MTGETTADSQNTDDVLTRIKFRLDALWHRVGLIWAAAMQAEEPRGPLDYDAFADERRLLINIIRKQTEKGGGNNYNEAPKESRLMAVVVGCTVTLLCAFIIGSVVFSNQFSALQAQVTEWKQATNEWKAATDRRLDRLEQR